MLLFQIPHQWLSKKEIDWGLQDEKNWSLHEIEFSIFLIVGARDFVIKHLLGNFFWN